MTDPWEPDVLGEPYRSEVIPLTPDAEGAVEAVLVHRPADRPADEGAASRAVLYVHGYADYFFQTGYADWWAARGYDFYALDLRKYGRALRTHQTPNYVEDIAAYAEELDAAWHRVTVRDGHERVVLSAHSTGGLTSALWAHHRRPAELVGVVLNSPWLDMQGSALLRTIGTAVLDRLGVLRPRAVVRKPVEDSPYGRLLHRDHHGEWEYDLAWKPLTSWPVYAGWLRAIRRAHAELHRGLDLRVPVLVLTSSASSTTTVLGEEADSHDIVLDVAQIRRWSTALGPHVTVVSVEGARHDVVLSREGPRARVYDELGRWAGAYLPG